MERATLKIEIPFTDHAHCIGRQGNQIQSIMTMTDTHIHFPDSNREPNGIKSNLVSITGTVIGIEQARKRIKDILPMSLKFLIPSNQSIDDDCSLFEYVRKRFHVNVLARSYTKTGDSFCIVRGLIHQIELAEATEYLIQAFYGLDSPLIHVSCQIEVSEQYHIYLKTRQQTKDMCINSIEQYTRTTIQFPTTVNNQSGRRTSVIITGLPTQVCQARKLFDFCLPIILTFEIPFDKEPNRAEIAYLKEYLNVSTVIRTRKDRIYKLISFQTQEYNSERLFHARSIILDSTSLSFSNLSIPNTSAILTNHLADSLFIPIDTVFMPSIETTTKRLSPIGYERSSSKNFDTSPSSNELSSLFQSTFEENETVLWPITFDMNNSFSYLINEIETPISPLSFLSI